MRLLNTETLSIESFDDSQGLSFPYAILSHVWGPEEVLFHEVQERSGAIKNKAGWIKMANFCAMAREHGFSYAWIDTCCIDKRYSAELSEAINSMYKYYSDAAVCFIYLEDVQAYTPDTGATTKYLPATRDEIMSAVSTTRWLTRGWTLQEFLTPRRRRFFAADWSEIKHGEDLLDALAKSTGISKTLLEDRDLIQSVCIGERLKWAAKRKTTRGEDIAYSLMGLFNVSMPVLYGEGAINAFKRLQREIMQSSFDMTIFAWRGNYESSGLLARSPADFADIPSLRLWAPMSLSSFSMMNIGLSIRLNVIDEKTFFGQEHQVTSHRLLEHPDEDTLLAALQCDVQTPTDQWQILMIYLEPVIGARFVVNGRNCKAYRRIRCSEWVTVPSEKLAGCPYEDILVLQDEQYELVRRATSQHNSRREISRV
ncbi:HET-domain-containing protein [Hypoxylon sp. NC0597]|nr:HET-domain-containing protein [Hypoxylon sp. NC0597]